mmetsp:Transcript_83344/g.231282  ORF Transcript_83344/g.231282 Transcript_83344/m.231282 type:complete len:282 (+) Transcript_83344:384-1229(+)
MPQNTRTSMPAGTYSNLSRVLRSNDGRRRLCRPDATVLSCRIPMLRMNGTLFTFSQAGQNACDGKQHASVRTLSSMCPGQPFSAVNHAENLQKQGLARCPAAQHVSKNCFSGTSTSPAHHMVVIGSAWRPWRAISLRPSGLAKCRGSNGHILAHAAICSDRPSLISGALPASSRSNHALLATSLVQCRADSLIITRPAEVSPDAPSQGTPPKSSMAGKSYVTFSAGSPLKPQFPALHRTRPRCTWLPSSLRSFDFWLRTRCTPAAAKPGSRPTWKNAIRSW